MNKISQEIDLFLENRRAKHLSASTVNWYAQQLSSFSRYVDECGLPADDPDTIEAFLIAQQKTNISESTLHARFRAIRAFMRWYEKRSHRKRQTFDNPVDYIDAPKVAKHKPRVADPNHLKKLLMFIGSASFADIRDKFIVRLLWSTGVRINEACNLTLNDVDLVAGSVLVRDGKGGKDRLCPFGEDFKTAYLEYLMNRPATTCEKLLLSAGGKKSYYSVGLLPNGVRQMLERRCVDAGIKKINPHSIRHLYAIERLNNGMALSAVSSAMGHTSVSFTAAKYAKWVSSGLRREYDNATKNQKNQST